MSIFFMNLRNLLYVISLTIQLSVAGVQALDRIRRVHDFTDICRKLEDRCDRVPVFFPGLHWVRIFLGPLGCYLISSFQSFLFIRGIGKSIWDLQLHINSWFEILLDSPCNSASWLRLSYRASVLLFLLFHKTPFHGGLQVSIPSTTVIRRTSFFLSSSMIFKTSIVLLPILLISLTITVAILPFLISLSISFKAGLSNLVPDIPSSE